MYPRSLRSFVRSVVRAGAILAVGAVAYEAGAHEMGRRTVNTVKSAVERAKEDTHCPSPAVSASGSDSDSTAYGEALTAERDFEVQANLAFAQTAELLHAHALAAHHLRAAARALNATTGRDNDQAHAQQTAAHELDAAASELDNDEVDTSRVERAVQAALRSLRPARSALDHST